MSDKKKVKLKGKAFKRALKTNEIHRLEGVPLITDETVFITPEIALEMLKKNPGNRDVNWIRVRQIKQQMLKGEWKFHAQGIILDNKGNLITGQKRLHAIAQCGIGQWMRVSRGSPPETASLIDRGVPQSPRDLAQRITERKHSIAEASIVRAIYAYKGNTKPNIDDISEYLVDYNEILDLAMISTKGIKKTKSINMILAAICLMDKKDLFGVVEELAMKLEEKLHPTTIDDIWNKGAAFTLAIKNAVDLINRY